jgi:solute:Na+ symporter, SSS family
VLAAYTYSSGLRAPALIAFVKDTLIYIVILVAVFYLPAKLGGWGEVFNAAEQKFATDALETDAMFPSSTLHWAYASLALGSALALFMYPHSITAVLSTRSRNVIRRNASLLPAYSFLLGLLALLGFVAIAAGIETDNAQLSIPLLFEQEFPGWFAGIAFAAIAIGALVPAAIMSIAAANLWTRNIYKAFINPDATPAMEARQSKLMSLLVKFGALVFALIPALSEFAINLQLLGGIWILQTLPAVVIGLYTRWLHRWALLTSWAVAMVYGTWIAWLQPSPTDPTITHFGSPVAPLPFMPDVVGYIALTALVINLVVAVVLTWVFRAMKLAEGVDATVKEDYRAEAGEEGVEELPEPV